MFNFNFSETPLAVHEACPACIRQQIEHSGRSIIAQRLILCTPNRRHIERLLRDYTAPRQEITVWLNFIRAKKQAF